MELVGDDAGLFELNSDGARHAGAGRNDDAGLFDAEQLNPG